MNIRKIDDNLLRNVVNGTKPCEHLRADKVAELRCVKRFVPSSELSADGYCQTVLILQQASRCTKCHKLIWADVPIVEES